jgi:hypothetical protein
MPLIIGGVKEINGPRGIRPASNTNARFAFEMGHSQWKSKKQDYRKKAIPLQSSPQDLTLNFPPPHQPIT